MILSCKKNTSTPDKPSQPSQPTQPPQQNPCSAKIADTENIEIFPSDNAWNKDVSSLSVDPYSNQIIASFASSPLKAESRRLKCDILKCTQITEIHFYFSLLIA